MGAKTYPLQEGRGRFRFLRYKFDAAAGVTLVSTIDTVPKGKVWRIHAITMAVVKTTATNLYVVARNKMTLDSYGYYYFLYRDFSGCDVYPDVIATNLRELKTNSMQWSDDWEFLVGVLGTALETITCHINFIVEEWDV